MDLQTFVAGVWGLHFSKGIEKFFWAGGDDCGQEDGARVLPICLEGI